MNLHAFIDSIPTGSRPIHMSDLTSIYTGSTKRILADSTLEKNLMVELGTSVKTGNPTAWEKLRSFLPQAAPPEPRREVKELIAEVHLSQGDISKMFQVYQRLRRQDGNLRTRAKQLTLHSSVVINVVNDHRIYVQLLLRNILQLGGCNEYIDWDHFVYVFVQFCSLTKVEICQLMFLFIVRESRGLDIHYLTSAQLDRFYDMYRPESGVMGPGAAPPPPTMLCSRLHFSNFPLSRYYMTDFVEICFLYSQLINPIVYLQRQFRRVIPSLRFWDNYENYALIGSRKITAEYFSIKKANAHLLKEEQFQETTDLLLLSSYIIQKKIAQDPSYSGVDPAASAWGNVLEQLDNAGNGIVSEEDKTARGKQLDMSATRRRGKDFVGARIDVDVLYNQLNHSAILKKAESS